MLLDNAYKVNAPPRADVKPIVFAFWIEIFPLGNGLIRVLLIKRSLSISISWFHTLALNAHNAVPVKSIECINRELAVMGNGPPAKMKVKQAENDANKERSNLMSWGIGWDIREARSLTRFL